MDAGADRSESQLLHERWGHCSWKRLSHLTELLGHARKPAGHFCVACIQAKSHAKSTKYIPGPEPSGPLDVVIADGVGPVPIPSHSGMRYYEHVRCIWSHYNWVLFTKKKSDYPKELRKWIEFITKQIGRPVGVLHRARHRNEVERVFRMADDERNQKGILGTVGARGKQCN